MRTSLRTSYTRVRGNTNSKRKPRYYRVAKNVVIVCLVLIFSQWLITAWESNIHARVIEEREAEWSK